MLFGEWRRTTLADPKLEALRLLGAAVTKFGVVPDSVLEICHRAGWSDDDIKDAVRYVTSCGPDSQ